MLWLLRATWVALPITAGTAATDALDGWSDAPRLVASVLLWAAWAAALLALLAPRPVGVTTVRTVAPLFLLASAVAAPATSGWSAIAALATTVLATVLALLPPLAEVGVAALAYGDEQRFPLKVPPVLMLGPAPVAVVVVGAGLAAGPILLADERIVAGVVALAAGLPAAVLAARALHGLIRRMVVTVPAGVVVVDPMTLADPHLFPREKLREVGPVDPRRPVPPEALDLRMGAALESIALHLADPATVLRARPGRRGGSQVEADTILVAPVRPRRFLQALAVRWARHGDHP